MSKIFIKKAHQMANNVNAKHIHTIANISQHLLTYHYVIGYRHKYIFNSLYQIDFLCIGNAKDLPYLGTKRKEATQKI